MQQSGDRLFLSLRSRQWGRGCALLLWLVGWTVGCVFLAGMVRKDPKLFNILFAVPFWASWIFVFFLVLKSFFQRDQLILSADGIDMTRRVLVPIRARSVPLSEIQGFATYSQVIDSESNDREWGIEMRTLGKPLRFFQGLPDQERVWLEHQLNELLTRLRGSAVHATVRVAAAPSPAAGETDAVDVPAGPVETLAATDEPVDPPTDCSWQRLDEFDAITFLQQGRFPWLTVCGLAFANVFWNGIVATLLLSLLSNQVVNKPQGFGWWGALVFLIPFEAAGLLMFVVLIAALLEPFRRTTWRFQDRAIVCHMKWLSVGPVWRYGADSLDRIQLHRADVANKRPRQWMNLARMSGFNETRFQLTFVDVNNAEVCSMHDLTEGEARWIADVVLRQRSAWFR